MSLAIRLSREYSAHLYRFKAGLEILYIILKLFKESKVKEVSIYKEYSPLSSDNKSLIDRGNPLEQLREILGPMDFRGRSKLGLELEGEFIFNNEKFSFSFEVYPEMFQKDFDLQFEIYAKSSEKSSFSDLVKGDKQFLEILYNNIKEYNGNKRANNFKIKKAFITKGDLLDIRERVFSYYMNRADMIEDCIKTSKLDGDKEAEFFRDKLALVNEQKISNLINRNEKFNLGVDLIFEKAATIAIEGSLCLIPSTDNSMEKLFLEFKDKVLKPIAERLVSKSVIEKQINELDLY